MNKKLDILLLIGWLFISLLVVYLFRPNFFVNSLVFFGIPSLYLSLRAPHHIQRTTIFAGLFGVLVGFIADSILIYNGGWVTTSYELPKILGLVPIEDLIWSFLMVYNIIIFYEYFLDRNVDYYPNRKQNIFFYTVAGVVLLLVLLFSSTNTPFHIPYPYWSLGMPALIVVLLISNSRHINRFILASTYFFFVTFIFEFCARYLDHWYFPSKDYIGMINLFNVTFPFEEFLFFCLFFSFGTLAVYEYFFDYKKR